MCTVLLRFAPDTEWPLLLAAVRDEFMHRAWDPPAAHWPTVPTVLGGRDRVSGGTWTAVETAGPAVAALLNGVRRGVPADGSTRPTRGRLPLAAVSDARVEGPVPGIVDEAALAAYDGFHLLRADRTAVRMWTWDGVGLTSTDLPPGDHIVVNLGADRVDDPLVPFFAPRFAALPVPGLVADDTVSAWNGWIDLLRGGDLEPTDERGLIIEHVRAGDRYGSTSASLVALGADGTVRYDFTATPRTPDWHRVPIR